jgi:hypothetical protein
MDLDGVELVWLSDLMSSNADEYWPLAMDVARKIDVSEILSWLRAHASIHPKGQGDINVYLLERFYCFRDI